MPTDRRLVAIMFTDIVGYTALMGENERHAFEILERNRELHIPLIKRYNGELIKELGDGVLASFPNATDAALCAMAIQTACHKTNAYKLRIGIHMGEVVFQNNDVFGDGVNIASRIQALAPPGGIWVSEPVRQNVFNKEEIITRFVREEKLKNVKEAVRIHEIIKSDGESFSDPSYMVTQKSKHGKVGTNSRSRLILLFSSVLLLLTIGLVYWFFKGKSTKQIKSIAVMPFLNESANTEVEYLSDGITETMISYLSQLPDLDVKARSSVFRYKGKTSNTRTIGKELNVEAVLTGRLMQRGQELSVYIELVDPVKETVMWTGEYRQPMTSLVSLQSEITWDVVQKLKTKLSRHEEQILTKNYTSNSEAYNHYLKGRFFWNQRTKEGLKKANEEFHQAIANDSNYALAYSGIADTYSISRGWTGTSVAETFLKAKAAAMRSLQIDSTLAEAHASMGLVLYHGWQWSEAEKEFKKSILLNPRYASAYQWYGLWLEVMGKKNEAIKQMKQAQQLEPLQPIFGANLVRQQAVYGSLEEAMNQGGKLIEVNPSSGVAHQVYALTLHRKGLNTQAIKEAEKAVELTNRDDRPLTMLGFIQAKAGKSAEAYAIIKELEEKYIKGEAKAVSVAGVYAGLGNDEAVFRWLEKGFAQKSLLAHELLAEWHFNSLQNDPRFKDLLKRMNLTV